MPHTAKLQSSQLRPTKLRPHHDHSYRWRFHILAALILFQAFSPQARADVASDMLYLAFPDRAIDPPLQSHIETLNSLGIIKLSSPVKLCVLGLDETIVKNANQLIDEAILSLPEIAQRYIDRNCESVSPQNVGGVDALVWVSSMPWKDAKEHLVPYIQRQSPNMNVAKTLKEYEKRNDRVMVSVSIESAARKIRSLLIVRVANGNDYKPLSRSIFGFLFVTLNPKLYAAKPRVQLAEDSGAGKLKPTTLTRAYLGLLYSDSVKFGDTKDAFLRALSSCIQAGRC